MSRAVLFAGQGRALAHGSISIPPDGDRRSLRPAIVARERRTAAPMDRLAAMPATHPDIATSAPAHARN